MFTLESDDGRFVADLEDRLLPYFEGPEGSVLERDLDFAHTIKDKAKVARLRLSQIQPRIEGEQLSAAAGRLLRRKANLGPRLDAIIAKALARVRSVS